MLRIQLGFRFKSEELQYYIYWRMKQSAGLPMTSLLVTLHPSTLSQSDKMSEISSNKMNRDVISISGVLTEYGIKLWNKIELYLLYNVPQTSVYPSNPVQGLGKYCRSSSQFYASIQISHSANAKRGRAIKLKSLMHTSLAISIRCIVSIPRMTWKERPTHLPRTITGGMGWLVWQPHI